MIFSSIRKNIIHNILMLLLLLSIITITFSSSISVSLAENPSAENTLPEENTLFETYKDIPGVTEEEIKAIESIKQSKDYLYISNLYSSEAFFNDKNQISGFLALFSEELSGLFGIKFVPQIDTLENIQNSLTDNSLDFATSVKTAAENYDRFIMSDKLIKEPLMVFRLKNSEPIEKIARDRTLNFAFIDNSIDSIIKMNSYSTPFNSVYVTEYEELSELFESGEIDAFISNANAKIFFDDHTQYHSSLFLPIINNHTALSTGNEKLAAFISVFNKYLTNGGKARITELYDSGNILYQRHQLAKMFTPEEKQYIDEHNENGIPIPFGPSSTNYPICFYNEEAEEFQGISIDVLNEISRISTLKFEPYTEPGLEWHEVLNELSEGRIDFVSELLFTIERKEKFIWTDEPYAVDNYALLSKIGMEEITIEDIPNYRIGLIFETGYANIFREWFPYHTMVTVYNDYDEGFSALEDDEIDFLMGTNNLLLNISNYLERPGFKANIVFDYHSESSFGFKKDDAILASIMSKAQSVINTEDITTRWSLKAFDFRAKVQEERIPYIIGAVMLGIFVILLLIVLFFRKQNENLRLETTVQERTLELENQTNEARIASQAKSDFLSRMSHEIRTPLNAIIGMSNIAQKASEPESKAYNSIGEVIGASKHLLDILNDILDMSKIESGKFVLSEDSFNLNQTIDEVQRIIEVRCKEKTIVYVQDIDIPKDLSVIGDRIRLKQVLINLLGNAVKFTPEYGMVTFAVDYKFIDDKSRLNFSIIDTGIGIKKEQIEKLFNSFEQADNSIASRFGGTGLGLSISQSLVSLMGGNISIESEENVGSTFSFEIDLPIDNSVQEAQSESDIGDIDFSSKRILIVEDVEINRIILMEMLADSKINIDEAEDGVIALEMFSKADPSYYDLIFMDIQMPNMDGYETTRNIRALDYSNSKDIPIIAMSANAFKEDIDKSLESGMNKHISKPLDTNKIIHVLWEYLIKD